MGRPKKRRIRTEHDGVYIQKRKLPGGGSSWRARYVDPDAPPLTDAGKPRFTYLTLKGTEEQRKAEAIELSKRLAERVRQLAGGDAPRTRTPVADAVAAFFVARLDKPRSTNERRRTGIERFVSWANTRRVVHSEDLTPALLSDLRTWIIADGRLAVVKGAKAKRGERRSSQAARRPATVNTDLTSVKILLNHLRAVGKAPRLSRDVISDSLKPVSVARDDAEYLSPAKIRALLAAAERHDAAMFKETRAEHRREGRGALGTTAKHVPIAQFVRFLLWTGCRRGEALQLLWSDVDLDALDPHGQVVGEIRLRAETTKTRRARTIGLEVSPALRAMLRSMRDESGGDDHVFHGYTGEVVDRARERLMKHYKAPEFDWQVLRSTCATYLTNAPGIFGAATVFLSARQLGHSVAVAEKNYLGTHRGVPKEAKSLEDAMQLTAADAIIPRE